MAIHGEFEVRKGVALDASLSGWPTPEDQATQNSRCDDDGNGDRSLQCKEHDEPKGAVREVDRAARGSVALPHGTQLACHSMAVQAIQHSA
jgi:hypothetical protein